MLSIFFQSIFNIDRKILTFFIKQIETNAHDALMIIAKETKTKKILKGLVFFVNFVNQQEKLLNWEEIRQMFWKKIGILLTQKK